MKIKTLSKAKTLTTKAKSPAKKFFKKNRGENVRVKKRGG